MKYHHGDLRRALLQRAEEVIADAGIEAVKLSVLARDIGVSHGAPARHFKDRNALLGELALRALDTLKDYIAQAKGMRAKNPRVRLNTFLKCQVRNTLLRPAHFILLGHPDLPRIAGEAYDRSLAEHTKLLRLCVRDAQRSGWRSLESESHVVMLAYSLAIGLQTLGRFSSITRDTVSHEDILKASAHVSNAMKAIDLFIPCQGDV